MKKLLLIFSSLLFVFTINGQNVDKNLNEEPVIIQKYLGNGDRSNTSNTPGQRNEEMIAQVNELSKQLNQARLNGKTQLVRELEKQINALVGSKEVSPDFGPQATPLVESIIPNDGPNNIGISIITPGRMRATATTTQNTDGRIWVATTNYADGATDTLRIFYSDNGGLGWSYLTGFTYPTIVDFRTDDLDIEVLNDGTDWYIYITGGFDWFGAAFGFVARYKTDGTGFFYLNLPKSSDTDQYWARVVSDYPRHTSLAKVYIVATMDSVIDATTRMLNTRAFVIEDPYALTPTVLDRNNHPFANAYWFRFIAAPIEATLKMDVAYFDSLSSGDRIVTCSIFENTGELIDSEINITYSDNAMVTVPYLTQIVSLTYISHRPSMSFSGGNDQISGCITTTRNFNNMADTDARYMVTNDGGATWNQGYFDASLSITHIADVIGLRGVDGHFKFAWLNEGAPLPGFWYGGGSYLGGSFVTTPDIKMNGAGIFPDSTFGGRAGYRLTGSDSCFAVFVGPAGVTAYGVSGCSGPVTSVENDEIPVSYSLSQNYPNPFNPSTLIKYSVPENGFVRLSIYNLVGEEISVLVNETVDAGFYEVAFNAANLSSGTYFYRLQAGNTIQVKKMVLLR
ncbi:MAG: T9SS type A sorting domain-containing protein [Bacteroidetes bacterium]|nr:T9SS type A sorting domain-containing protein [Bacteroidota bacterium]